MNLLERIEANHFLRGLSIFLPTGLESDVHLVIHLELHLLLILAGPSRLRTLLLFMLSGGGLEGLVPIRLCCLNCARCVQRRSDLGHGRTHWIYVPAWCHHS